MPFDKMQFLRSMIGSMQNRKAGKAAENVMEGGDSDVTDVVAATSGDSVDSVVDEAVAGFEDQGAFKIAGVDNPLGEEGYQMPDYSTLYGDMPEYDFQDLNVGGQGTPVDPLRQGMLGFYGPNKAW